MRVLMLASTFPRHTGDRQPTFILDLARALVDAGVEVTVLAPGDPAAARAERIDGVEVRRFRYAPLARLETLAYGSGMLANVKAAPWRWLLLPLFLAAMTWQVRRLCARGGVDTVHAHWVIPQGLCAALALATLPRARRPRLVVTAHGADLGAFEGRAGRALKRFTLRRADALSAVSLALAARIRAIGGDDIAARTIVAPMGIALPTSTPARSGERAGCCFVGRFVEKKGVLALIDAWALARDRLGARLPVLTLAGDGALRDAVVARIAAHGLQDRVVLAGWLARDALSALVGGSLFSLMPSRRAADGDDEGFGLVAIESLALGTPVVACDFDALADIRAIAGDGLRTAASAEPGALAAAIVDAVERPFGDGWTTAGVPQKVCDTFAWPAVARRYGALYEGKLPDQASSASTSPREPRR